MHRLEIQNEFDNAMKNIITERSVIFDIYRLLNKDELLVTPFINQEYYPIDSSIEEEYKIIDIFKKTREVNFEKINYSQIIVKDFLINNKNELVSSKRAYWNFIEGNLDDVIWHLAYKYNLEYKDVYRVFKRRRKDLEIFVISTDVNEKRFSLFCKLFINIFKEEKNKTFLDRFFEWLKK